MANDFIVSASIDGTSRLWSPSSGQCLRVFSDAYLCPVLSCRFQPLNNNMIVVFFLKVLDYLSFTNIFLFARDDGLTDDYQKPVFHRLLVFFFVARNFYMKRPQQDFTFFK